MIVVELEGAPLGKGRPRAAIRHPKGGAAPAAKPWQHFTRETWGTGVTKKGAGKIHIYTPTETSIYEEALGFKALEAMRGKKPLVGPVWLTVSAYLPIPKSWSKAKRRDAIAGRIRPTVKPDFDNIQKIAADALNKIVWLDDAQIVCALIHKVYSTRPRLRIEIATVDSMTDSR
jgi:Holliday junction resolvase RusA-like endonuclease